MKYKRVVINYLFPVLLLLYALRHVTRGIDLWDGGYNYANFTYSGLKYMDAMWYFATWLANVTGSLIARLPFGHSMLGMNCYTALIQGGIAVVAYQFCVKRLSLPAGLTAIGEFLALSLCWAPSAVLYNYLTYGLMLGGIILLYQGLTRDKAEFLVFAGVVFGINTGVRFPNLAQAGFIMALWYDAIVIRKEKLGSTVRKTGLCILGYMAAVLVLVAVIFGMYGMGTYVEGIQNLFHISDTAPDYSTRFLLFSIVETYIDSVTTYWMKRFGVILTAELLLWLCFPERFHKVKKYITVIFTILFLWYIIRKGYCTADYKSYQAIFYPVIFWLFLGIILCIRVLVQKETDREEKMQAVFVLLTIYISSLGSNNAMYSCINNLFLVGPLILHMSWEFVREKKKTLYFPLQMMLVACSVLVLVQGAGFGIHFVCERAAGARDLSYEIREIPVLQGMHTGQENGQGLESLYRYLKENGLDRRRCILYGDIPGLAYYMQLEPAMNIWGDLLSYGPERMRAELDMLQTRMAEHSYAPGQALEEEPPIVIIHTKYADAKDGIEELSDTLDPSVKEKLDELYYFMHNNGYSRVRDIGESDYVLYVK